MGKKVKHPRQYCNMIFEMNPLESIQEVNNLKKKPNSLQEHLSE